MLTSRMYLQGFLLEFQYGILEKNEIGFEIFIQLMK